ncbi:MAG: radical SAM/SPASM domain-containing protein [Candidatus Hodarchaeota archaeon]
MPLIDYQKLQDSYDSDGFYALQLEVGDLCNQGCVYCYMNALPRKINSLTDDQIASILYDSKKMGITAIEWLGGEPLLREGIFEHMALALELNLKNNIWSGGLPLKDEKILENCMSNARNGLISVHVSTINPQLYELLHPGHSARELDEISSAVDNLITMGYPSDQVLNSVTFTGLQPAEDMIETFEYFNDKWGIKPSLNVYHTYLRPGTSPGQLSRFIPSRKEVAKVHKKYSELYDLKDLPMNCVNKQYCSATLAVLCDGSVTPCATIRDPDAPNIHDKRSFLEIVEETRDYLNIQELKDIKNRPEGCQKCKLSDECWGCRSRAFASGNGILGRDPRCFRS